ncbi:MAG: hypothetical protein H7066_19905 [Cytophagaceae bacterium]|nr:hypothetical protein [Gemmatimonadaceae bacterium]
MLSAPVIVLGAMQMGAIYHWATRTATWWALVPLALHALAIALAVGLPVVTRSSRRKDLRGFRAALVTGFGDRASRLHALKDTVLLEVALLFAWPLATTALAGGVLRWGVGFTIAVCALAVIWPLQRIADAQRSEGERLQGLVDRDAP